MKKVCYVIAGPNGAGKSTFAEEFLPNEVNCYYFINADMIAKGISPLRPEAAGIEAGRLLFQKIDDYIKKEQTFAFESTLSGKGYRLRLSKIKASGYYLVIYYLKLASAELAVQRVKNRVNEGGHSIPEADINRRFERSWVNFINIYQPMADEWIVFDNSGDNPQILEHSK
jgi:predicted ABC-type ATPase